jgi:hypothetical protein
MLKIVKRIVILLTLLIVTLILGFTVLATLLVSDMDTDTTVKTVECIKDASNCRITLETK